MTPLHAPPPGAFLYQDPKVSVSASELAVGTTVYPIHTITAARIVQIPPQRAAAKLLLLMAGFGAAAGAWKTLTDGAPILIAVVVAGIFVVLAAVAFVTEGPGTALRLWTPQGEVDAVISDDRRRLDEILAALTRAAQRP